MSKKSNLEKSIDEKKRIINAGVNKRSGRK